jgi:hypothetical protein
MLQLFQDRPKAKPIPLKKFHLKKINRLKNQRFKNLYQAQQES